MDHQDVSEAQRADPLGFVIELYTSSVPVPCRYRVMSIQLAPLSFHHNAITISLRGYDQTSLPSHYGRTNIPSPYAFRHGYKLSNDKKGKSSHEPSASVIIIYEKKDLIRSKQRAWSEHSSLHKSYWDIPLPRKSLTTRCET